MHHDELAVTDEVVRTLVGAQFPRWSGLHIRRIATSGTVNAIVRIGDDLVARLPLRGVDAAAIRVVLAREARASAALARHSPVPAPRPVALGEPGPGYPLPWAVQTWLPGVVATESEPGGSSAFAEDLAVFILSLRVVDTRGARFEADGRGGDLHAHDGWMETCFAHSAGMLDVARLRVLWSRFRELPRHAPDVMSHGDLIPGNVLVADGRLAGVLDGGGFGPADPALDLVAAWHLLDDGPRAVLRERLGCDDLEWARGAAWAFEQAMGVVWHYRRSNPPMSRMGMTTLGRIIGDR